jgi:hypothetical protein
MRTAYVTVFGKLKRKKPVGDLDAYRGKILK